MVDGYDLKRYLAESGISPSQKLRSYIDELQANASALARVAARLNNENFILPSTVETIRFAPASSPWAASNPIDFVFLYVSLNEYIPTEELTNGTPESAIQEIINSYDRHDLLLLLAQLNRQCDQPEDLDRLTEYYRSQLKSALRERLDMAMSRLEDKRGKPRIVARHCILAAMKELLRQPLEDGFTGNIRNYLMRSF